MYLKFVIQYPHLYYNHKERIIIMKKFISLLSSFVLTLTFTACSNKPAENEYEDFTIKNEIFEDESSSSAPLDISTPEIDSHSEQTIVEESADATDWEEFIEEYEEWVDDYVEFMENYNDNPTDPTLLTQYTNLATELSEWAVKADDLSEDLTDEEAIKFSTEIARINTKLATISY